MRCGVNKGLPRSRYMTTRGATGPASAVDFCARSPPPSSTIRKKTRFVALDANERSKEVQNARWIFSRELDLETVAARRNHDLYILPAVVIMTAKVFHGAESAKDRFRARLNGSKVCVQSDNHDPTQSSRLFRAKQTSNTRR